MKNGCSAMSVKGMDINALKCASVEEQMDTCNGLSNCVGFKRFDNGCAHMYTA